jgi:predicted CXXCH cytochrome family protein
MERGHHPTGIQLPEPFRKRLEASPLKVPLDARRRIACTTCHDTGCASNHQVVTVRHYGGEPLKADLCWACHDRGEFAQNDPHSDDPTQCRWCHQLRPSPGREAKKTLLAAPTMVCLLCHEPRPHPGGADHLRVPTEKYRPAPGLPLGLRREVTCATCHEPHLQAVPLPKRLRVGQSRLCGQCHPR